LALILDTAGNVFHGFTPLHWDSRGKCKCDHSLTSFLFMLKDPHNIPARKLALKAKMKHSAIWCSSLSGPKFGSGRDIGIQDGHNRNTNSQNSLDTTYNNHIQLDGFTFFTCLRNFPVKEIEIFKITDSTMFTKTSIFLFLTIVSLRLWAPLASRAAAY
jgi:hypothetical protein